MRVVVLCATRRGYRFLEKLYQLLPGCETEVFSFQEEPWEPPFLDDIRRLATEHGGRFTEARRVGEPRLEKYWRSTSFDLMLAVSWRYMVPPAVYRRARLGAYVFHDSPLPEYRGFSPTVWAVINGEDHTGVTLFEMVEEVDAGDIVAQERIPIGPDETIAPVLERVTVGYLNILERSLPWLVAGNCACVPQDHSRATYMRRRLPEDNRIHWEQPAGKIFNLVRAVTRPYPGAYTSLEGKKVTVWEAADISSRSWSTDAAPGTIVDVRPGQGSVVSAGQGALLLTRVQFEGEESRLAADAIVRVGLVLGI